MAEDMVDIVERIEQIATLLRKADTLAIAILKVYDELAQANQPIPPGVQTAAHLATDFIDSRDRLKPKHDG